jgi:hypothetical protein
MTQEYIPFSEIVSEIAKLCKQKATGTLFVVTSDNRSAQMMLDKGEIVYIFFSSKRGEEALQLMSTIHHARYRFQEGGVVARRMPLPATQAVIQSLINGSSESFAATSDKQPQKASNGSTLSAEQKKVLETCLADCIGPMAAIICEDYFNSASDLQTVIEALSGEIPSAGQVQKFRTMVAEKLK